MAVVKVWGRGQLTIPASLRKELHLDEEAALNVVKVGEALILTPKKLLGDALAKKAQKEMEKADLSLEDLLEDLEKQRERYNRERYGG
jgi:AbrB family looped-hinge helix DNA binding protein